MTGGLISRFSGAVWTGLVLAAGISLSGCAAFTGGGSVETVERAKFPVPPGGLAANKSGAESSWGVFQPVALNWTGNTAPAGFAPAMPASPQPEATPDEAGLPSGAWPAPVRVPPAGSALQSLPQAATTSAPDSTAQLRKPAFVAGVLPAALVNPGAAAGYSTPVAPAPAFTASAALAPAAHPAPQPRQMLPWNTTATTARQVAVAAVQPPKAVVRPITPALVVSAPKAPVWAVAPRPALAVAAPQPIQRPRQPEVVVDYSVLTAYAPPAPYFQPATYVPRTPSYVAPAAGQVQHLGQVTIDYSVLQN